MVEQRPWRGPRAIRYELKRGASSLEEVARRLLVTEHVIVEWMILEVRPLLEGGAQPSNRVGRPPKRTLSAEVMVERLSKALPQLWHGELSIGGMAGYLGVTRHCADRLASEVGYVPRPGRNAGVRIASRDEIIREGYSPERSAVLMGLTRSGFYDYLARTKQRKIYELGVAFNEQKLCEKREGLIRQITSQVLQRVPLEERFAAAKAFEYRLKTKRTSNSVTYNRLTSLFQNYYDAHNAGRPISFKALGADADFTPAQAKRILNTVGISSMCILK